MNRHLLKSECLGGIFCCLKVNKCIVSIATYPYTYHRLLLKDLPNKYK